MLNCGDVEPVTLQALKHSNVLCHDTITVIQNIEAVVSRERAALIHKEAIAQYFATLAASLEHGRQVSNSHLLRLSVRITARCAKSSGALTTGTISQNSVNVGGVLHGSIERNLQKPVTAPLDPEVRLRQVGCLVHVTASVILEPPAGVSHELGVGRVAVKPCVVSVDIEQDLDGRVDRLQLVGSHPDGLLGLEARALARALLH